MWNKYIILDETERICHSSSALNEMLKQIYSVWRKIIPVGNQIFRKKLRALGNDCEER